jgi:antitoxin PrlF
MASSILTAKGQTTIPKEIRERLGVRAGDRLDFVVEPDGRVMIEPAFQGVVRLKGLLAGGKRRKAVSVEAMHAAIRQRASGG